MANLESMVIDINSNDKPSVNFGGGIELLMNDKKKGTSGNSGTIDLDVGELSQLENELNNLSEDVSTKTLENSFAKNLENSIKIENFESSKKEKSILPDVKFSSNLGEKTAEAFNDSKTWDGYGKYSNIPQENLEVQLSKEELIREKFKYLRMLEDLETKGATLTKKYTIDSPLNELKGEYEMIISEKEKSNSVKFQGKMLMAAITGLEFLNNKFDPFDLKMDGWGEQVNENISDYDEIFAELHEKYKSKAKMAPELKLLFQLGGSAIMVHMTNTMFKSAIPGMDDIMKQNPELMQQFTQAAVNSMGDSNPGFGNFMNNFVPGGSSNNSNIPVSSPPVSNMGPPPPSINTQSNKSERYAAPTNRPDLAASKSKFQEQGIDLQNNYSMADGNNSILKNSRNEMKGPSDISNLLSGLKVKQINVNESEKPAEKNPSTISIEDLKGLTSSKIQKPSKSKKPSRSEKNTISLDL